MRRWVGVAEQVDGTRLEEDRPQVRSGRDHVDDQRLVARQPLDVGGQSVGRLDQAFRRQAGDDQAEQDRQQEQHHCGAGLADRQHAADGVKGASIHARTRASAIGTRIALSR